MGAPPGGDDRAPGYCRRPYAQFLAGRGPERRRLLAAVYCPARRPWAGHPVRTRIGPADVADGLHDPRECRGRRRDPYGIDGKQRKDGRMRVLAVGAHPDDLEILCGGTLARFVAEGHSVVMCHVSDGNCGSFEIEPPQLARVRSEEAAVAAAVIGARHEHLGVNDGEVSAADRSQQHLVVQLFRDVRPDVVITHSPDDYMRSEAHTSELQS